MANWANVDRLGNPLAPGWQDHLGQAVQVPSQ